MRGAQHAQFEERQYDGVQSVVTIDPLYQTLGDPSDLVLGDVSHVIRGKACLRLWLPRRFADC